MPIWIELHKIPLQYFHPKGISYLASAIEKPLHMDRNTALRSRLDYAKVCIEIDMEKEVPEVLKVDVGDDYIVEILVDVPWVTDKCAKCKVFGYECTENLEQATDNLVEEDGKADALVVEAGVTQNKSVEDSMVRPLGASQDTLKDIGKEILCVKEEKKMKGKEMEMATQL
ncbi:hypothetical protein CRG98_027665 [Punica granatum]|uniref:Uncharacterized protein n=1 Tax=Punica granatum TaxID=22663 RepID=A0A2I0J7I4_PUNGR|nr:hypothetical protein CRG98_027665 [Punica granatum]